MTEKRQTAHRGHRANAPEVDHRDQGIRGRGRRIGESIIHRDKRLRRDEFHEKRDEAYEGLLVAISNFEDEISQRATVCGETRGYDSAICDLQELSKARRRLG